MNPQEMQTKLIEAQNLMSQEKYKEALNLLGELKEIEKSGDFDYNLTHKLYQLISNSKSLLNQQIILKVIKEIQNSKSSISFNELNDILVTDENLEIEESILKREIEILILRSLLQCKIDRENLIFT
jgi:hypothetical protein